MGPRQCRRARVLVVEPDAAARLDTCNLLEQHGFAVEAAESAEEMASILRERPADLVLLEHLLPSAEEGLTLCRRLTQGQQVLPVIICSSRSCDVDRIDGLEAGADDFFDKRSHPRELLARIKAVLRRRLR